MGAGNSVSAIGGSVPGAIPDAIGPLPSSVVLPSRRRIRQLGATVPSTVRGITNGNQRLEVTVDGKPHSVVIPKGLRAGAKFRFSIHTDETDRVYASTLPSLPGMKILHAKEVVFGSVCAYNWHQSGQGAASQVGKLIAKATDAVRGEAIDRGCNAVLGIAYNVTADSSGEYGREKTVVVTATGTPCVVAPISSLVGRGDAGVGEATVAASAPPTLALSAPDGDVPIVTAQPYVP
ncbi:hypothetical protein ACHAWF_007925 [Thalassiosira exigua]